MKCNERHHRVEQVEHVLQHVAEDGHGVLLLGGERFAVDHGLLDFKVAGADSVASSHTKRYRNPASSLYLGVPRTTRAGRAIF